MKKAGVSYNPGLLVIKSVADKTILSYYNKRVKIFILRIQVEINKEGYS